MTTTSTVPRLAAIGLVAGALTLGGAVAPAFAAPAIPGCPSYPPGQCRAATVSDSTPAPGQTITVTSGEGEFTGGSSVVVTFDGEVIGTVTADGSGTATITYTIPSDTCPGQKNFVFSGDQQGAPNTATVPVTVTGDNCSPAGGGLPFTGAEVGAASLVGVGLVGGGFLIVVAGRRRRVSA